MSTYDLIYKTVRKIPAGKVATYGQIADLAGIHGKAGLVGYAMFQVDTACNDIPWHRVINAKGEISYSTVREGGIIYKSICWKKKELNLIRQEKSTSVTTNGDQIFAYSLIFNEISMQYVT